MITLEADTDDGVRLRLRRFAAVGTRRAVLLCGHAMMAHGRYFHGGSDHGFAGHLARAGVEVFVLDWRGHGLSRPPHPGRSWWSFDSYVEHDLPAAVRAVCRCADIEAKNLAYLGHSLGGLAVVAALATQAIAPLGRLALWATSVWLPGPSGSWRRRLLMRGFELAARPLGYVPIRRLRLGSEDEGRGYVAQLAQWARTGQWCSAAGNDYLASLAAVRTPTWAVCGAGDRLCTAVDAQALAQRLPLVAPLRVVGRASGDALDADHFQLFTRRELAPLWDQLIDFIAPASSR